MGSGIAQVAAAADINVFLVDTSSAAIAKSREALARSLDGGIERGKLTPQQAAEIRSRIRWQTDYRGIRQAEWIVEAVFEAMSAKRAVLERIDANAAAGAVISTNTSTLSIDTLAEISGRPERFIGLHFFNPPPAMKLVEIIPGSETLEEVMDTALQLCERMGKEGIVAPDIPGFFVNRVFGAILSSAIDIWAQGADPADIDRAIELGLAHRMGPLATADLVGLDVVLALLESLGEQTGHERFDIPEKFRAMVNEGRLGRKSGEGFYSYND